MERYYKHTKLLSFIIILGLLISGCTNRNPIQPIEQDAEEKIIGVEVQLPVKHSDRILTHAYDIEVLQEELLVLGATQITVVLEKDDSSTVITPAELDDIITDSINEGDYTGMVMIHAEGDYDVLSEGLAKESSHALRLQKMGFKVYISPYYETKNS